MKKSKKAETPAKKLDRLATELGTTIKGMTMKTKQKSASNNGSQKFERFPKRKLKATDKELKRTIKLMIDKVEKRVTVEPFNAICFRSSDEDIMSNFIFFGDSPLDPQAPVDCARFHDIVDCLRKSVTGKGEEADEMLLALDDLSYALCFHSEQVGSYMGVLMGAAMMGASHDKLKTIGQGIYNHYRWDTA